ncbi:hypothetical protein ME796_09140 [Lactobacillus delbrueckii]|nr:hypothetical protein ME796_09140 [Lactobacillus delbrueckii]
MQHICVSLVPLFVDLPEKDQLKINSLASHRRYQKGETIFQPGDEKLQIVARGNMKVYQLSASGREQLLRVAQPGTMKVKRSFLAWKTTASSARPWRIRKSAA